MCVGPAEGYEWYDDYAESPGRYDREVAIADACGCKGSCGAGDKWSCGCTAGGNRLYIYVSVISYGARR